MWLFKSPYKEPLFVRQNNNKKFQILYLKLVRHLFVQSLPCFLNLIRSCPVDRSDRFWIKYHARDLTHLCQLMTKTTSNTVLDTSRKFHTGPGVYCSSVHHFLVHHIPLSDLWQAIFLSSSIMILEPRQRQNIRRWSRCIPRNDSSEDLYLSSYLHDSFNNSRLLDLKITIRENLGKTIPKDKDRSH